MGRITVWIMSLLFVVSFLAGAQEKNEIGSLSFVEVHPVVDSIHAKTQPMLIKGWTRHVYLDPGVVLDLRDIKRAYAVVDSSSSRISYMAWGELTIDGGKKLGAWTNTHVGKRIGIIVNKKLIAAPMIRAQIMTGQLLLAYCDSKKMADQLVSEVNKALTQ